MRPFRTRIALAMPVAALPIAAPAAGPARAVTYDVSIVNFDFRPAVVSIAPGDTVRWTNLGTPVMHTTTDGGPFDAMPGQIWDSGIIPGDISAPALSSLSVDMSILNFTDADQAGDLSTTISAPPTAPPGHYTVKVKVGTHPSIVAGEDSFEGESPSRPRSFPFSRRTASDATCRAGSATPARAHFFF